MILFIGLLFLAEIAAYAWHRWGAHSNIDLVGATHVHQWHHTIEDDPAHYDFAYIVAFLTLYGILLLWLHQKDYISQSLALTMYLPFIIVALWSWYVHAAYHTPGHWLEQYQWFLQDRELHWEHHRNPSVNYGIATHFSDVLGDTFSYGLGREIM